MRARHARAAALLRIGVVWIFCGCTGAGRTPPDSGTGSCSASSDCPGEQICSAGRCIPACASAADCENDERCNEAGVCVAEVAVPVCGNGVVEGEEACDAGDANAPDGDCTPECTQATCGDGYVHRSEACDDGNQVETDACRNGCLRNTCGDGVPGGPGEACDDGNDIEDDECTSKCAPPECGDGLVNDSSEACDDGNASNEDACLNTCVAAECGDGFVQQGVEDCDRGADNADTSYCKSDCTENICGDGHLGPGEQCDTGAQCGGTMTPCDLYAADACSDESSECSARAGDGCGPECNIETDWCCIDAGHCVPAGTVHPETVCLHCDPSKDQTGWSYNDGEPCRDNADGRFCAATGTAMYRCSAGACEPQSCPDNSPYCVEEGQTPACVPCTRDAHCKDATFCEDEIEFCTDANECDVMVGAGPCSENTFRILCDEANDRCVECFDDADCEWSLPPHVHTHPGVCDGSGTCSQCQEDGSCPGAMECCGRTCCSRHCCHGEPDDAFCSRSPPFCDL